MPRSIVAGALAALACCASRAWGETPFPTPATYERTFTAGGDMAFAGLGNAGYDGHVALSLPHTSHFVVEAFAGTGTNAAHFGSLVGGAGAGAVMPYLPVTDVDGTATRPYGGARAWAGAHAGPFFAQAGPEALLGGLRGGGLSGAVGLDLWLLQLQAGVGGDLVGSDTAPGLDKLVVYRTQANLGLPMVPVDAVLSAEEGVRASRWTGPVAPGHAALDELSAAFGLELRL